MTITISKSEDRIKVYAIFGEDTKTGRMHTRYCKFRMNYTSRLYQSTKLNERIERIKTKLFDRWSNQFWMAVATLNKDHLSGSIWKRGDTRFVSGGDTILYSGRDGYCKIHLTNTYEAEMIRSAETK